MKPQVDGETPGFPKPISPIERESWQIAAFHRHVKSIFALGESQPPRVLQQLTGESLASRVGGYSQVLDFQFFRKAGRTQQQDPARLGLARSTVKLPEMGLWCCTRSM